MKTEKTECEEIREKTDQQQAELIADRFSAVSNEYSPIDESKINIPAVGEDLQVVFTP